MIVNRASKWLPIIVVATIISQACNRGDTPDQEALIAELARDTTIIEQPDRAPEVKELNRMLGRLGIPFQQRLSDDRAECLVRGNEVRSSPTVYCNVRSGVEPLKLHIVADSDGYQELQVLNGSAIAQRIDLMEFERPDPAAPALYAEDLDGDETREVVMQRFAGATGNSGFTVWRVDPIARHVTADSAMSAMVGIIRLPGRPCVLQSWNTSARDHVSLIECFLNRKWQTVWESSTQSAGVSGGIARLLEVMIGDTLRIIRVDTVPNPN